MQMTSGKEDAHCRDQNSKRSSITAIVQRFLYEGVKSSKPTCSFISVPITFNSLYCWKFLGPAITGNCLYFPKCFGVCITKTGEFCR